jgi:hypothetical protein
MSEQKRPQQKKKCGTALKYVILYFKVTKLPYIRILLGHYFKVRLILNINEKHSGGVT